MDSDETAVSEAQWDVERARTRRVALISSALGFVFIPALSVPALYLANVAASGVARYPVTFGFMLLFFAPSTFLIVRASTRQQQKSDAVVAALARQSADAARTASVGASLREQQAKRQEFESRLANALDMAEDEAEVIDVIERSLAGTLPSAPVELLLADNSHAHLLRVATASPDGQPPGCTVTSPDHCPAARRSQVQRFANNTQLDTCPKLRDRPQGAVGAICLPVSIMGRTVGVLHALSKPDTAFEADNVAELATLANLAGARIGLLRVMADTQLQAATDSLTGLFNRRTFEKKLTSVRAEEPTLALAMADLDHFKTLNDTYGHETGDRALRLFADVLRNSFRAYDILCRHGGEEFLIAFPACSATDARRALDGMRARLDAALTVAGLPKYTVSIGVVAAAEQEDLPTLIARADTALFTAKKHGRDQVVVHDAVGQPIDPATTEPANNHSDR